jgi:hypothetical protein
MLIYNNVFFNLIELGPICVLARDFLSHRVANNNLQENHFMDAISDGHQRTIPYKCAKTFLVMLNRQSNTANTMQVLLDDQQ